MTRLVLALGANIAIQREKRIKDWLRPWKVRLIEEMIRPGGICPPT